MPRVSVIVPIFNGSAHLPAFFQSLQTALPERSQVILIDDASIESVFDLVPEFPRAESVIRLRNETNLGYSVAVNRGFVEATGDFIVQLNTDLVLESNCISAMVDLLSEERDAGVVGSKLVYPTTGLVQHVGMAFGHYSKPHIYFQLPADHRLANKSREVQITTGATVAMTRRVLQALGPLEERYFNHNEDIDHCLLARRLGFRNFVSSDSVAFHWVSQSGPSRFVQEASSEALFWSRWGASYEVDLGRFVDEALDHVLNECPELLDVPFHILDLSRGADHDIVLDRLTERWPGIHQRARSVRQTNNPEMNLRLPLLLPHFMAIEPVPFIYLVDQYSQVLENRLWFEHRREVVVDELVVDLTGVVLRVSEISALS